MSEWINTEERLPDAEERVLICYGDLVNRLVSIARIVDVHNGSTVTEAFSTESNGPFNDIYRMDEVSHWMPLPKATDG
jgi:hypothetical protein